MNKKVLSAILFSALFAGTGTFTSCIDNDEPAGIEELRGAKAELIRAKVAVEQADATFRLAEAELKKAEAATEAANTRIKEAEAKIKEAEAEKEAALTAEEKARVEKQIAIYKQEMANQALQLQADMFKIQQIFAENQRNYELALAKIAIAKELFPLDAKFELSQLQSTVDYWNMAVGGYAAALKTAQEKYNNAAINYEYFGKIDADSLQYTLDTLENKLAKAQADLAKFENWLEEDVTTKDWRAEVDELKATVDSLAKLEANFKLDSAKAEHSLDYQALKDAAAKALIPATVDSVYGYKYFGDEYATTLYGEETTTPADTATYLSDGATEIKEDAAKLAQVEAALDSIAQYNATTGDLEGGILYDNKAELASFTAEVRHFLDSVANKKAEDDTIYAYNANKAIKAWSDTLAMYKNADATVDTKWTEVQTAYNAITDLTKPASYGTLRTKLIAYYTAAIANGAALNKVPVQVKAAGYDAAKDSTYTTSVTSLVDMMTALNDATNGNANVKFLFDEGMVLNNFKDSTTVASDTIDYVKADGKAGELAFYPAAFNKLPMDKNDMLQALVRASDNAFGDASLYNNLTADYTHGSTDYLHVQPDSIDVLNIAFFNGLTEAAIHATNGTLGEYGKYLIAQSDAVKDFANNYESIMEDLEAAIAYWEATYKTLDAKFTAWETALDTANKALADYEEANLNSTTEKIGELTAEIKRLNNIVTALQNAIEVYLPEALDGKLYGEKAFYSTLETIVAGQRGTVNSLIKKVAIAKKAVELNECDSYSQLTTAKEELDAAIADLEAAQAELDKATETLLKALEIYEATIAE